MSSALVQVLDEMRVLLEEAGEERWAHSLSPSSQGASAVEPGDDERALLKKSCVLLRGWGV